ncbi:DUF6329 domain-containing protein [Acidaminobacter sp.]|uniref:DUF6329 domain-containing protein n=1 Tax=Acidaminobacter sp. TaxID=1872102 RepID=UPI0025651AFC|nr:DUF6329 domain-containing protein [Acidaminobacter sp.]MDK9711224.1 DUF6329 domain-containing protein [Acidaminobacter sp.]
MLKTNAIFFRKVSELETQPCVIEAIQLMNQSEYDELSKGLLRDRSFISDKKEDMFTDQSGQTHCLLALNEESGDGILIDSSGYNYARYISFMPNIKAYIDQQISQVADQILQEAAENTSNGSWIVYFDEIAEQHSLNVKVNNGIGTLLVNELQGREEMAEINLEEDCLDMTLYLDFCKNINPSELEQNMGM